MFFLKGEPGELGEQGPKGERGSEVSRKETKAKLTSLGFVYFTVHWLVKLFYKAKTQCLGLLCVLAGTTKVQNLKLHNDLGY